MRLYDTWDSHEAKDYLADMSPELEQATSRLGLYALRLLLWTGQVAEDHLKLTIPHPKAKGWTWDIYARTPDAVDAQADYSNHDIGFTLYGDSTTEEDLQSFHYDLYRGNCSPFGLIQGSTQVLHPQRVDSLGKRVDIAAREAGLFIVEPYDAMISNQV